VYKPLDDDDDDDDDDDNDKVEHFVGLLFVNIVWVVK
jgi:hypothetical protein